MKFSKQKKLSDARILFLAFIIPLAILIFIAFVISIYPFGKFSTLTVDLNFQYISFLSELRRKILAGESLFYSWSVGLGNNFFTTFSYYAASPFNLLLLIIPEEYLIDGISFLILMKISLISLSFSYLLINSQHKLRDNLRIFIPLLSTSFALSGFVLAYYWNIMWLDVIILLPLLVLGVQRLILDARSNLYIFSLSMAILSNYYLAFFLCVFIGLYFFTAYFSLSANEFSVSNSNTKSDAAKREAEIEKVKIDDIGTLALDSALDSQNNLDSKKSRRSSKANLKNHKVNFVSAFLRIIIASVISIGISAIIILPNIIALKDTSAAKDLFPHTLTLNYNPLTIPERFLIGAEAVIRKGLPNVYFSLLVFLILPLYLYSKKINFREKLAHLVLLGFIFLSMNVNILNFFWHGMHYPNQLPYRYSFLLTFLLILIAYRTLSVWDEFSSNIKLYSLMGTLIYVLIAYFFSPSLSLEMTIINLIFIQIYLYLFKRAGKEAKTELGLKTKTTLSYSKLIIAIVILELSLNCGLSIFSLASKESLINRKEFLADYKEIQTLLGNNEIADYQRLETLEARTHNDGALYGYKGFSQFNSSSTPGMAKLMNKLGFYGNDINSYVYRSYNPVANAIFGLDYLILRAGEIDDIQLKLVDKAEYMSLLKVPVNLSWAKLLNKGIRDLKLDAVSPYENYNKLLQSFGIEERFNSLDLLLPDNLEYRQNSTETYFEIFPNSEQNAKNIEIELIPPQEKRSSFIAFEGKTGANLEILLNGESILNKHNPYKYRGKTSETVPTEIDRMMSFYLGEISVEDELKLIINCKDSSDGIKIFAASMDTKKFTENLEQISKNTIELENISSNSLNFTYNTNEDSVICLNIPYDKSWQAFVDGKAQKLEALDENALILLDAKAGKHEVELRFIPCGFYLGVSISILALLCSTALLLFEERRKRLKIGISSYGNGENDIF